MFSALVLLFATYTAAPQLEFKLDAVGVALGASSSIGSLLPKHAETSIEVEGAWSPWIRPFLKVSRINNLVATPKCKRGGFLGCEEEGDEVESVYGIKGHAIRMGWKLRPFEAKWIEPLELGAFYKWSAMEEDYHIVLPSQRRFRQDITRHAVGLGAAYSLHVGKAFVVEPFWMGDYGYSDLAPMSEEFAKAAYYPYEWDDEQRFGLNLGVSL